MINLMVVEPKQGFDSNLSPRRAPTGTAAATPTQDPAKSNTLGAPLEVCTAYKTLKSGNKNEAYKPNHLTPIPY